MIPRGHVNLFLSPLRVYDLQGAMSNAAAGHSDDQAAEVGTCGTLAVTELGCFVDNLVEGGKHIVGELYFDHWLHIFSGCANRDADYALF